MDPERRAPRLARNLRLTTAAGWTARVVNISAVGLRAECEKLLAEKATSDLTIHFESGAAVEVKVVVVWAAPLGRFGNARPEVGMDIIEAAKDFYDQLPPIQPNVP